MGVLSSNNSSTSVQRCQLPPFVVWASFPGRCKSRQQDFRSPAGRSGRSPSKKERRTTRVGDYLGKAKASLIRPVLVDRDTGWGRTAAGDVPPALPSRDQSVRYRRRHRGHGVFVSSGEVGVARILWVAADLVPGEILTGDAVTSSDMIPVRPSRWLTIAGARPVQYTGTRRPQEKKKKE